MTLGSITFCIVYGILATIMMICGYNIMSTFIEKIKRSEDKEKDSNK